MHTPVSPSVTPLVGDDGSTWYPVAELEPVAMIIGPGETRTLSITLQLPAELPAGVFRGSLVLQGFLVEGVPIEITVRRFRASEAPTVETAVTERSDDSVCSTYPASRAAPASACLDRLPARLATLLATSGSDAVGLDHRGVCGARSRRGAHGRGRADARRRSNGAGPAPTARRSGGR